MKRQIGVVILHCLNNDTIGIPSIVSFADSKRAILFGAVMESMHFQLNFLMQEIGFPHDLN